MVDKKEDYFAEFLINLNKFTESEEASQTKEAKIQDPRGKLINYQILLENSVFWSSRQSYFELMKSFLKKEMGGEEFQSKFLGLRSENRLKTREIDQKIEEGRESIPDFYYTSKSVDFKSAIDNFYFELDNYDPNLDESESNDYVYSKGKLRSIVEIIFPIVQKSCDINNSSNI